MFVSVFMLNLIGLFPFYYSTTATILIPVVISITVSLVYLFRRAKIYQEYFLTHLVPQTNSLFLSCFVYIVEAIGLIIRAFSLGLRLTCNVLCGHLLISIISVFLFKCFMCTVSYTGYYHLNFYSFEQWKNILCLGIMNSFNEGLAFIFYGEVMVIQYIIYTIVFIVKIILSYITSIALILLLTCILLLESLIMIIQAFIITKLGAMYTEEAY